jgi:DNA-binding PadR family transcriptional regulator
LPYYESNCHIGETVQKTRTKEMLEVYSKLTKLLALKKEYPQYKMDKELDISYRTLLRHLKNFENTGSIKARTEPSEKGGKDKKIYSLTFKGLVAVLRRNDPLTTNELERVIYNHPDMLLMFRKYPLFKEVKKFYLFNLRTPFISWLEIEIRELRRGYEVQWTKERYWEDLIDEGFFAAVALTHHPRNNKSWEEARSKFLEISKNDPEIRIFIRRAIARRERELREIKSTRES